MDVASELNVILFLLISFVSGQRFCTSASKGVYSNTNVVKHLYAIPREQCSAVVPILQDPGLCAPPKTVKGIVVSACDWIAQPVIEVRGDWSNATIIRQGLCSDVVPVVVNMMCQELVLDVAVEYIVDPPKVLEPISNSVQFDIIQKPIPRRLRSTTTTPVPYQINLDREWLYRAWKKSRAPQRTIFW